MEPAAGVDGREVAGATAARGSRDGFLGGRRGRTTGGGASPGDRRPPERSETKAPGSASRPWMTSGDEERTASLRGEQTRGQWD